MEKVKFYPDDVPEDAGVIMIDEKHKRINIPPKRKIKKMPHNARLRKAYTDPYDLEKKDDEKYLGHNVNVKA